ncbi:MAG: deoxyguanosinetriphosphate triphosphohydrolase [Eubacterium sp.]|jgi:dGTPase|nr:deoxyguanosinetriphosphate triphosphohydrolase [Eubacterium sp.]MCH4047631.1 deoxyguanosinetriphosphate triphosphohydrolase [Eubacterium sp.]MCH4078403.1 deoxyguanosinetriphosphate triphosphohydrolase [Eubacterium sp.]MCH4109547.1 deoxyguanosinetriphosphate triphosphohydrolase [Eubacterium sp.]MCI1306643.1 deoxyguanosinetriphosphate triphosphohydrolase [Eubacterium sp.]
MRSRTDLEGEERKVLSPYACLAEESRGRAADEPQCPYRTVFQRDRDRIIHSKAFRRLMHKTQVFLAPEGDHYRTRLTHTLEVSQVGRSISRALGLNEDLTEAIALGHDLGHTPFGHNGERILNDLYMPGFSHNEQSLRVVDKLEFHKGKRGMNLTYEVRDGILNHPGKRTPHTLEGWVVKLSDRIAYLNHDIDDAVRAGALKEKDLPEETLRVFGESKEERLNTMIENVITTSDGKDYVRMDDLHSKALDHLRTFMFEKVYDGPMVRKEEQIVHVERVIRSLYQYYLTHPEELPKEFLELREEDGLETVVKDHIAGMTDRYALTDYRRKCLKERETPVIWV